MPSPMMAWVEFYCQRYQEIHRLAFQIIQYSKFYQHYNCPEGYYRRERKICIHDHAIRVAKFGDKHPRTRFGMKSKIYTDTSVTISQIIDTLKEYIQQYYSVDPDHEIKAEVDFT